MSSSPRVLLLNNSIQNYAWGRFDGIADAIGTEVTGSREAELWVGAHHRNPSVVAEGVHSGRRLDEVIGEDPQCWLGPTADSNATLPFLLKVLAIGEPLSLQAHPTKAQAEAGFAREDSQGIALDAAQRTYQDRSDKPEILVALETTYALCGFRKPDQAAALLRQLGTATEELVALLETDSDPLRSAMAWLLSCDDKRASALWEAVVGFGGFSEDLDDPFSWVHHLSVLYNGDPTVVAPLLLQLVRLEAGESVHLPAGNLHAYLSGSGVELMAASDNVLRGGLTPKHIDRDELLKIVSFEPGIPPPPQQSQIEDFRVYDAGEQAFSLAVFSPGPNGTQVRVTEPSVLLATGEPAVVILGADRLTIGVGQALFVAPGEQVVVLTGGAVWWATSGSGLPS